MCDDLFIIKLKDVKAVSTETSNKKGLCYFMN